VAVGFCGTTSILSPAVVRNQDIFKCRRAVGGGRDARLARRLGCSPSHGLRKLAAAESTVQSVGSGAVEGRVPVAGPDAHQSWRFAVLRVAWKASEKSYLLFFYRMARRRGFGRGGTRRGIAAFGRRREPGAILGSQLYSGLLRIPILKHFFSVTNAIVDPHV